MLGKLARWMRLLGYDTLYNRDRKSMENYIMAIKKGRLFITRNRKLTGKKDVIIIKTERLREQLKEIKELLPPPSPLTRCPECNLPLKEVEREQLRYKLPPYIFMNIKRFHVCPGCGRLFWEGSHTESIKSKIKEIFNISE